MFSRLPRIAWVFCVAVIGQAAAQAPAHDAIANAVTISSLPFAQSVVSAEFATTGVDDPVVPCRSPQGQGANSLWYRFSTGPQGGYYNFSTDQSSYETIISLYTGSPTSLRPLFGGCNDDGVPDSGSLAELNGVRIPANTSVYIEVLSPTAIVGEHQLEFAMAEAPRYLVTTTLDSQDGACTVSHCSLREAVSAANANPGAVLLGTGTYALAIANDQINPEEDANQRGDLDVLRGMGIYGAGTSTVISSAGLNDKVVTAVITTAGESMTLILDGMTLRDGRGASSQSQGGAVSVTGARSGLYVGRAQFLDNRVISHGGAITAVGDIFVEQSTFRGNSSNARGGAIHLGGSGKLEIRDSLFAENAAGNGGAVYSGGSLTIINSTFSGNSAVNGGAINFEGAGAMQLLSSTVTNNTANMVSGTGGGVHVAAASPRPLIRNSVITGNSGSAGTNDCDFNNATGTYNHFGVFCMSGGVGNTFGAVSLLALANLGGVSEVVALAYGSPLIDSADPAGCSDDRGQSLENDQRGQGFARNLDGNLDGTARCDKGAFELLVPVDLFRDGFE